MATLVLKNVTENALYIRDLSDTIDAGETVTVSRSLGELTAANALNAALADGSLLLVSYTISTQESLWVGASNPPFTSTGPLTLYVATTGDDANNGLATTTPLRNITTALKKVPFLVQTGHPAVINVAAGTYDERIDCPALTLLDNVSVVGAAMTPTTPGTGVAEGTFDASFGTQAFPHRAVLTGAGWTVGGLTGGWFIEILSGANTGAYYPVVNNTATTLDLPFPCNSGGFNMQSVQFRLVKPSVIVQRTTLNEVALNANAPMRGETSGVSTATSAYLIFENITFNRTAAMTTGLVRALNGAFLRFKNCAFLDGSSGGILVTATNGTILRMDDCLTYRPGLRNNTNLLNLANSTLLANRYGAHGGNFAVFAGSGSSATITNGFAYAQDTSFATASGSRTSLNGVGVDASQASLAVAEGSTLSTVNCQLKNSLAVGVMLGFQSAGSSLATASVSGASANLSSTTIDACPTGIAVGANSTVNLNTTTTVSNCTTYGVNLAGTLRSGHNIVVTNPSTVMTGNTADFTLNNGTTTLSLTALRALSPKASTDATFFNRLVEV